MSRITQTVEWLLRQPFIWGGMACMAFYYAIRSGLLGDPTIIRYVDSHPIERVTVTLFFIGLAALIIRLFYLTAQFATFNRQLLEPIPMGGQPIEDVHGLLGNLFQLPEEMQNGYLVSRLREALQYIRRKDSADDLDDYLRHLEEADAIRMSSGYAMVRIIVWAIPILGFLGTVIGITMAIAKLSPEALENSLTLVTSKLGLAFDTTALALGLSIVLMFIKFCVERVEDGLLARVDTRTSDELVGRFLQSGSNGDPNVISIQNMAQQVIGAVETMSARQAEIWKSTIDDTHEQWAEVTEAAGQILQHSLGTAMRENYENHAAALNEGVAQQVRHLSEHSLQQIQLLKEGVDQQILQLNEHSLHHAELLSEGSRETAEKLSEGLEKLAELLVDALEKHGDSLANSEQELAKENRQHLTEVEAALGEAMVVAADRQETLIRRSEDLLKEMKGALADSAGATIEQQTQLVRQGETLLKIVDATGQVTKLEDSLNKNLSTLSQTHHFEETLTSLAAAIQLLSIRLSHTDAKVTIPEIHLDNSSNSAA